MTALKRVIVGDTTPDLAELGSEHGAQAVYAHNIEQAKHHAGCYFVSLGDVKLRDLLDLLDSADEIVLQNKPDWSTPELEILSRAAVQYHSHRVPAVLEVQEPWRYVEHYERNSQQVLWAFGGSTVQGRGLDWPEQDCFAAQICSMSGQHTLVNTARDGTGLRRSVEALMHADVQQQDLVILDAVVPQRLRVNRDGCIHDLFLADSGREWVAVMTDDQAFYDHVSYLDIFVRHCRAIGCRLVFFNHQHQDSMWFRCIERFSEYPEWCWLEEIDFGNDGHHPGLNTHRAWAQQIWRRLQS